MEQQIVQEVVLSSEANKSKATEEVTAASTDPENIIRNVEKGLEQQQDPVSSSEKIDTEVSPQTTSPEAMAVDGNAQNKTAEENMNICQEIEASSTKEDHSEQKEESRGNTQETGTLEMDQTDIEAVVERSPIDVPAITSSVHYTDPDANITESGNESSASDTDSDVEVTQNKSNNPESQVTVQKLLHDTGLGAIASQYQSGSEVEDDNSSDSIEVVNVETATPLLQHRTPNVVISSDSDSDSDIEVVSQISAPPKVIEIDDEDDENSGKPKGPIRVKGELLLDDLPPIQDLHITVPEGECVVLGKVHSIIDQLVLVDSIPGTAALDLETVLFLDKGHKVLGEVFDVIGQVASPLYCVRFNSNKQIKEKGIEIGETVYVAPRTEHTHFIILKNLTSIRGSDASWEDDVEPPEKHLDYSDDEEERNARRAVRNKKQPTDDAETPKRPKPSPRRPRSFQSGQQYHSPRPNSAPGQPSSFQYDTSNTTWHANYNSPSLFPNPFARPPQFMPPGNNRPIYNPPNYSEPQFNSPNNNMSQFVHPNQQSSHLPPTRSGPQFVTPNMHIGADYSRAPFMQPNQPQMPFNIPPQPNQQFIPPNQQNMLFPQIPNRSQFASPDYGYRSQFSSPPPPLPRK